MMMKEYDTYVFDLDGTLLDTLADLAQSCNHALVAHGLPPRTLEEVRLFVGNGVKKLMERATPDGEQNPLFADILAEFRRHYLSHSLDHTAPYPGIPELLAELCRRRKHLAVVSNKFQPATQALCRHFFAPYLSVAIGQREDIRPKPAPDTVLEALTQLGVPSTNAVYIGDSDVDIATAHNSNLPCVSVLWGFRDSDFLLRSGATTLISHPTELL